MGWIYQVDIVRPFLLQLPIYLSKLLRGDRLSKIPGADFFILAKGAPKGTSTEKHSTGSSRSADAWLLPKMEGRSGYPGKYTHAAKALSALSFPSGAAASGTNAARLHQLCHAFSSAWLHCSTKHIIAAIPPRFPPVARWEMSQS